jgi:hypothetical protein
MALASTIPSTAELSAGDRAKLVKYLTATRDQVLSEAGNLSEAQWSFKAAPDRWSVGEVVEHLTLAEPFLFDLQQKTMTGAPATPDLLKAAQGRDEFILKAIPDRTQKAQAPEPLQPAVKERRSRADVLAAFKDRRGKTLEYAGKTTHDLRSRVSESPIGPVDGYQWLLFIGAHTERHLAQIREVKAHAQFPKGTTP